MTWSNILVQAVMILFCIYEVPSSNLSRQLTNLSEVSLIFFSFPVEEIQYIIQMFLASFL